MHRIVALFACALVFAACSETVESVDQNIGERHPDLSIPLAKSNRWVYAEQSLAPVFSDSPEHTGFIARIDTFISRDDLQSYALYRTNQSGAWSDVGLVYRPLESRITAATLSTIGGTTVLTFQPDRFDVAAHPFVGDTMPAFGTARLVCRTVDTTVVMQGRTFKNVAIYQRLGATNASPEENDQMWVRPGIGIIYSREYVGPGQTRESSLQSCKLH